MSIKEEVELLGYYAASCPHCTKTIYIPEYRQKPVTLEENRLFARRVIDQMKKR